MGEAGSSQKLLIGQAAGLRQVEPSHSVQHQLHLLQQTGLIGGTKLFFCSPVQELSILLQPWSHQSKGSWSSSKGYQGSLVGLSTLDFILQAADVLEQL